MEPTTDRTRAEASRENGKHSHGPVTEENRRKVAFNAVRTGYYAEQKALSEIDHSIDPAYEDGMIQDWVTYYGVQSPAAFGLVKRCVRSNINFDRLSEAHDAIIDDQLEVASQRLERRRRKQVSGHLQWLAEQPARAAQALRSTALGVRTLIQKFESIGDLLDATGVMGDIEMNMLVNMLGYSSQQDKLPDTPYLIVLLALHTRPRDADGEVVGQVARLTRPERRPESVRDRDLSYPVLPREAAVDRLRMLIDDEIERLILMEKQLRVRERVETERVLRPCKMIQDPEEARRYFQHSSDNRSTFHKAYAALMTTLKRDAEAAAEAAKGPAAGGEVRRDNEPEAATEAARSEEVTAGVVDTGTLSGGVAKAVSPRPELAPTRVVSSPDGPAVAGTGAPGVARGPGA